MRQGRLECLSALVPLTEQFNTSLVIPGCIVRWSLNQLPIEVRLKDCGGRINSWGREVAMKVASGAPWMSTTQIPPDSKKLSLKPRQFTSSLSEIPRIPETGDTLVSSGQKHPAALAAGPLLALA
jgi:hypothetical protein